MDIFNGEKKCAICKEYKPKELFSRDKQKKDGLRNYCKDCERKKYAEKRQTEDTNEIKLELTELIDNSSVMNPNIEDEEVSLKKVNVSVDHLAKLIANQYQEDLKKANEVYELFYNRIVSGTDTSQASKEALTKTLELRMFANESLIKLIQAAAKVQTERERGKGKGIDLNKLKTDFTLD